MKRTLNFALLAAVLLLTLGCENGEVPENSDSITSEISVQLNWFHDPTFAPYYYLESSTVPFDVTLIEGGVNISPIQKLESGLADYAVVGIDIALKAIASDIQSKGDSNLLIVFADFQRSPVGWVVHPDAIRNLGAQWPNEWSGKESNDWLFEQFEKKVLSPGDKRGTETTAVWMVWRTVRGLDGVAVKAVGFDPEVVLSAPPLAYPVYLNEQPFKLSALIGEEIAVFDPASDGIRMYGNVLVTLRDARGSSDPELLLDELASAWKWVRQNVTESAKQVGRVYALDLEVLEQQVEKTASFAFYDGKTVGCFDVAEHGELARTILALQESGSLSMDLRLSDIASNVYVSDRCK